MFDSSLLKRLEVSLMLGPGWRNRGLKLRLKKLSRKSPVAHRTLSVCFESEAGLSLDGTDANTHFMNVRGNIHT